MAGMGLVSVSRPVPGNGADGVRVYRPIQAAAAGAGTVTEATQGEGAEEGARDLPRAVP